MENENKNIGDEVFFRNSKIIIKCDDNRKIKIENLCNTANEEICKLSEIIVKLNNMPMSKSERKICAENIKEICYVINLDENLAVKNAMNLKITTEQNLKLKKRLFYVITAACLFLILIIASAFLLNVFKDVCYVIIYNSLGGILAVFYKQNSLDIDYSIANYIIVLEGIRRVIMTIVAGIIGFIIIKSNIILPNFDNVADKYTLDLIMVICGYSISFIPNILDRIIQGGTNHKEENNKEKN